MTFDEEYEEVPQGLGDQVSGTEEGVTDVNKGLHGSVPAGSSPDPDFPQRWDEEPDNSATVAEEFGQTWSKEPDNTAEKAEEFGERWAGGPDNSPERAEEFGAAWSGDTHADASDTLAEPGDTPAEAGD